MRHFLTILVACFFGTVARADVICSVVESSMCQQKSPTICSGYCQFYELLGEYRCVKSETDASTPIETRSTTNTYDGFRTADPGEPGYNYFTIVDQVRCEEVRTCKTNCELFQVAGNDYLICAPDSTPWNSNGVYFSKLQGSEPCCGDGGINP